MGLDMYLYQVPKGTEEPELGPWPENPNYAGERSEWAAQNELAYWRKFNALHAWFVRECGDDIDECQPIKVHPEKLTELFQLIVTLDDSGQDADLAEAQLPTKSGFFFGGTDIDEWYWQDVADTRKVLTEVLRAVTEAGKAQRPIDIYYEASW